MEITHLSTCRWSVSNPQRRAERSCGCPRPWAVVKDRQPRTAFEVMYPWIVARRAGIYLDTVLRFGEFAAAVGFADILVRRSTGDVRLVQSLTGVRSGFTVRRGEPS